MEPFVQNKVKIAVKTKKKPFGTTEALFSTLKKPARTQSPTTKNYAVELPPLGVITGVSQSEVQ